MLTAIRPLASPTRRATLLALLSLISFSAAEAQKHDPRVRRFAGTIDSLRQVLGIPGMSAAIVEDGRLTWAQGFGLSDLARRTPASPDTPYEIASITKPISSVLLLRLVEQRRVSLDDPMAKYSEMIKGDSVKVWHVLTHTSAGTPGSAFLYNGNVFATLFDPIVKASGVRFRKLLVDEVLVPIGARSSSPGNDIADNPAAMAQLLGAANESLYVATLERLSKTYSFREGLTRPTTNPVRGLSPANGLISSVTDLARFDSALDRGAFLKRETMQLAWTPAMSNAGIPFPYGLGWFVQGEGDLRLVWHYGNLPEVTSALYLKVPGRGVTLLLLANTDALSSPFPLGRGNVLTSAFACAFLRHVVMTPVEAAALPCEKESAEFVSKWVLERNRTP